MDRSGGRRSLHAILDVVGAAVAALLAFTAVPAVLVVAVGNPLAGGLGHAWRPAPRDVLCVLALAAWLAWAACCAQLVRAVVAHVKRGEITALGGTSVVDRVAARIALGVLALSSMGAPLALSSGAGASAPPAGAGSGVVMSGAVARHVGTVPARLRLPSAAATHAVQPGDTLWSIADDRLADGAEWTALAALNLGRDMPGGSRLVDPDHIEAGWSLLLPADARQAREPPGRPPVGPTPALTSHLPELVALGMGSLACAALARRARRHRRGSQFTGDLDVRGPLSEAVVDTATLLHRFEGVPALASFEAANCLLARSLQGRAGPSIRAICVSSSGVSFWLTRPLHRDAPEGFVPVSEGAAWHVDHATLDGQEPFSPYCPVVLPVGDDGAGTWLVPLGPGDVLPLLGESAASLWRAARAALGAWAWADTVLVTEEPDDPQLLSDVAADPSVARHLLFFGDPASLPPTAARRAAVVTATAVAASDLTILVDRHGATLHPMGRVVRPHLQSAETSRQIEELLTSPPAPAPQLVGAAAVPPSATQRPSAVSPAALAPGPVEVRLLTMTPRLDGLNAALPPNRTRRAVELVAYLALHHPDVITSDRLRTRVLGSTDTDAASKTLFNTAYAARRAMGVDGHGELLFPAGTRNGLYQVSPLVTVDVRRAIALAAEGKAQGEGDLAIAYLRAALDLVEGEPLANALSGYAWWETEGHLGHIAARLVDAACTLAALASATGHFDLARWGLERARLVEPYSETLSRAAMQVAAAEGDTDRLRFEWRECQRRVDALDPGSSPSPQTESLYGELSRRVRVTEPQLDARRPRYASAAND